MTTPPYGDRTTHWLDTLPDDQRERARRILAMPEGMAVAWVGVEVYQRLSEVDGALSEVDSALKALGAAMASQNGKSPNGRTQAALATLGGGIGGGGIMAAALVARMLGWT